MYLHRYVLTVQWVPYTDPFRVNFCAGPRYCANIYHYKWENGVAIRQSGIDRCGSHVKTRYSGVDGLHNEISIRNCSNYVCPLASLQLPHPGHCTYLCHYLTSRQLIRSPNWYSCLNHCRKGRKSCDGCLGINVLSLLL